MAWSLRKRRRHDIDAIGRKLVTVLVFWTTWVHRKVEGVALLEGERARRRVSLDLTVPDLPWPLDSVDSQHTLVPLATITKAAMRDFDAVDDGGASLPVLSTADNGQLGHAFLGALIEAEFGRPLADADQSALKRCIFGEPPTSLDEAKRIISRLHLEETFSERFLLRLAEEFILFAVLPVDRRGTRTVVKYSYHWSTAHPRGFGQRFLDAPRRIAAAAGWKPYDLAIELGNPDTANSLHLEVQAPAGLHCVDLTLTDEDNISVSRDTEAGTVAHGHTTVQQRATRGSVRFDPDLEGVHRLVTWSAWGVALLLLVTHWRLDAIAPDPGTPVSLLLFGPALLLTWLVRSGENWIVSAVVAPLRALALTLAGLLFAAAFALSLGFDGNPYTSAGEHVVDVVWKASIIVSVVGGMVLSVGRLLIRHRLRQGGYGHG